MKKLVSPLSFVLIVSVLLVGGAWTIYAEGDSTCDSEGVMLAQNIDYTCLNRCLGRGYTYGYCQSACSYSTPSPQPSPQYPRIPQTDYTCLNDCLARGYLYGFCKDRCSY